jgi:hypothetical protein
MEEKIINNLKERNVSDPTIKLYMFQLQQINDGIIENLKKFEDVEYVLNKLKKFKINTKRTKLISVIAMLKTFPEKKDLQEKYAEIVANINKETNLTSNQKTEKQKENWMDKQQIIDIWDALQSVVQTFTSKKNLSEKQYNVLLQFVVLSLYTLINPRRNSDFMKMIVVKKNEKDLSTDYNYLDLQKRKFIFNQYKTKKTYSQQVEDIPENLWNVIKLYLKFKPTETNYFLCNFDGQPLPHVNSITLILNKIFGRKIACSMLRNIFMTEKFEGLQKQLDELEETAQSIGTSSKNAINTYIKK